MTQEPYIKRKPLKGQVNRQVKFTTKTSQFTLVPTELKSIKSKVKQNDSILNVSLIEGSSFISNKHDGSLDSMDKMIIGVTGMGIDEQQFEEEQNQKGESKGSVTDLDFTEIHKQYEKLIGRNQLLGEEYEEQVSQLLQENSRVLPDQDEWQTKDPAILEKRFSLSLSPKKKQYTQNDMKIHLQKIQSKIDEMKSKKTQDNSSNSIKILVGNLGNLSQIHEEKEHLLNTSVDTSQKRINEEDQQDLIDFVRDPNPIENQSNTEKKNIFTDENEGNEWQVNPMLIENLELELEKQKVQKKNEKSVNCQQILQALNLKQEEQGESWFHEIFIKREQWIKSHKTKSSGWKKRQLNCLIKMKKILKNPQYESDDNDQ